MVKSQDKTIQKVNTLEQDKTPQSDNNMNLFQKILTNVLSVKTFQNASDLAASFDNQRPLSSKKPKMIKFKQELRVDSVINEHILLLEFNLYKK